MSKSKQLKPGQHLKVSNHIYTHHGIYVGSGRVIHYAGKSNGPFDNSFSCVQETSLADFAGGRIIYVLWEPEAKFTASEIVDRAKSRLGENKYSVLTNNCEHFVNWCIHGEHKSEQIQQAGFMAGAASTGLGVARVTGKAASTALNSARLVSVVATNSSSQAGLLVSAASGSGAASATAALTASGSIAGSTSAASLLATGSTLLASPAAPVVAVALLTGGLVYGAGRLFDWW